jgi:phospholipase/lecithinase/hemolysin
MNPIKIRPKTKQETQAMPRFKILTMGLCTAALLTACGGGGDGDQSPKMSITSMVSFGDSLSDVGTYKVGTVAALGGGRWTVNSPTAKIWTELLAAQYGLPAQCAAQTGLLPLIPAPFVGAAVQNFSNCRNYAQGSARVSSPAGPNSVAVQVVVSAANGGGAAGAAAAAAAAPLGLMAVPIASQMANHLAVVGGSYSGRELVTINGGANDVFMYLNAISSAATGGAAAVGAAAIAGWDSTTQSAVAAGGAAASNAAAAASVQGMALSGAELATYVKTQVVAKGAKYVVVVNIPDISSTPFVTSLNNDDIKNLVRTMVTTFNGALAAGLAGTPGVVVVDAYSTNTDQIKNPDQYGISNFRDTACSTTSAANPLMGSSLTCSAASTVAGDTSRFLFADGVHPTPFGYQLMAQLVSKSLVTVGWL